MSEQSGLGPRGVFSADHALFERMTRAGSANHVPSNEHITWKWMFLYDPAWAHPLCDVSGLFQRLAPPQWRAEPPRGKTRLGIEVRVRS